MKINRKARKALYGCALAAVILLSAVPVKVHADSLEGLYESIDSSMEINEDAGSATCDHACLIISGFLGVASLSNAVISAFFLISGIKEERKLRQLLYYMRVSDEAVKAMKERYPAGSRVLLERMGYDPNPIECGEMGTITGVDDIGTIHVDWDNGRRLGIIPGHDQFKILDGRERVIERGER